MICYKFYYKSLHLLIFQKKKKEKKNLYNYPKNNGKFVKIFLQLKLISSSVLKKIEIIIGKNLFCRIEI